MSNKNLVSMLDLLSEHEKQKYVDPMSEDYILKLENLALGDSIITSNLARSSSLDVITKTENGTLTHRYFFQNGKILYHGQPIEEPMFEHAKKRVAKEELFLKAVKNNDLNFIETMPTKDKINFNLITGENETPLLIAAKLGHVEMIKTLIKKGATRNIFTNNISPLEIFKKNKFADAEVESLLQDEPELYGQKWFIDLMKGMGYQAESRGFCFAVQTVGRVGILTENNNPENLANFNERFRQLEYFKPDTIKAKLQNTNQDFVKRINENKEKNLKTWGIENDKDLSGEQKSFLQAEKEIIRRDLHYTEQVILDIPAFFDTIEVFQNIDKLSDISDGKFIVTQSKREELAAQLVRPKALEDIGGEIKTDTFSGVYNKDELTAYFSSLREMMSQAKSADPVFDQPISLQLKSLNHSITVGYNPKKDAWIFIDANHLPAKFIHDNNEIAKQVEKALHKDKNRHTIMTTQVFIAKNPDQLQDSKKIKDHELNFMKHLAQWKNDKVYQDIHRVTPEKARATNINQASWLHFAADIGDQDKIKQLLKAGADPALKTVDKNNASFNNLTPLDRAKAARQIEAMKLLGKGNILKRNWKEALFFQSMAALSIAAGVALTFFVPPVGIGLIAAGIAISVGSVGYIKLLDKKNNVEGLKRDLERESKTTFVDNANQYLEKNNKTMIANKASIKTSSSVILGKVGVSKLPVNDPMIKVAVTQANKTESSVATSKSSTALTNELESSESESKSQISKRNHR